MFEDLDNTQIMAGVMGLGGAILGFWITGFYNDPSILLRLAAAAGSAVASYIVSFMIFNKD